MLLLWCSACCGWWWGEAIALSIPKGPAVENSCAGDSSADEGAVDGTPWEPCTYLGVRGSFESLLVWFMYSKSSVGNVWLLGRWKPGPPGCICLA